MKTKRLIFFGLLLSTEFLNAQTDYRPGYIIKSEGDTLYGEIDYRGDLLMSNICRYKSIDNTINEYSPKDIFAYRFVESKYYISREINGKMVFLEYLINGKVNIYYMRDDEGDHYYLDKEDVKLTEIPYEEGIKYVNDKQVFYETKIHIGILNYYMQDAPGIQSRIKTIKEPDHQNLIKLAEDYHKAVCKGEQCIIYEKKQPFLKVDVEVAGGIINFESFEYFESTEDIADKNYFQGGILFHLWMPRVNENLYFKTGFLYSPVAGINDKKHSYLKVPLHIEYLAPITYRFRPFLSIGLLRPSYSGGLIVKIDNGINIGIQSWVNFFPKYFFLIPSELHNYSLLGSLFFEL